MSDFKEVRASLDIQVYVDCPYCGDMIDLLRPEQTDGYDHNDEGGVLSQACPDGHWSDEHEKFELNNVTCSECKGEFAVKGMDWQ